MRVQGFKGFGVRGFAFREGSAACLAGAGSKLQVQDSGLCNVLAGDMWLQAIVSLMLPASRNGPSCLIGPLPSCRLRKNDKAKLL